jgi:hypothetical protein
MSSGLTVRLTKERHQRDASNALRLFAGSYPKDLRLHPHRITATWSLKVYLSVGRSSLIPHSFQEPS